MTSDLLSPSGPNSSMRDTVPPTVYRVAPDAHPRRVRRGSDGVLYGEVPLVPDTEDRTARTDRDDRRREKPDRPPGVRAVPDLDGHDNRPDPMAATTAAEFVTAMRRFRRWAGSPSYRRMQRNCDSRCSATSFHTALSRRRLPKLSLVEAFIMACGGDDAEYRRWATAWRRLELGGEDGSEPVPPRRPAP